MKKLNRPAFVVAHFLSITNYYYSNQDQLPADFIVKVKQRFANRLALLRKQCFAKNHAPVFPTAEQFAQKFPKWYQFRGARFTDAISRDPPVFGCAALKSGKFRNFINILKISLIDICILKSYLMFYFKTTCLASGVLRTVVMNWAGQQFQSSTYLDHLRKG